MAQTVEQLAQQLSSLLVQKQATGTPSAQTMHGPGGLFGTYGLEPAVINASLRPVGIDQMMSVIPTVYENPLFSFLTGFESDGSSEPSGVCDGAPGGVVEACTQTARFGRVSRQTKEIEVNSIVSMINRGETASLRLLGDVLNRSGIVTQQPTTAQDWINYVVQAQMVIVAVLLQRKLAQMIWQGNPANDSAGGGYREFPGLDILISTGKVDAITGTACPALDSDVKDFGYNWVNGTSPDIVAYLSMMAYYLRHVAERAGLMPVEWVVVMRPELWYELSAIWPVKYLTLGNTAPPAGVSNTIVLNDNVNVDMRDRMREQMMIPINGVWYPVITDDGIDEESAADTDELQPGEFASDIYIVPVRAAGMTTLYWEHLDYRGVNSQLQVAGQANPYWTTDNGRYLWTLEHLNWCFYLLCKIEPRVILRTPQLAGRLQSVKYSPLQHLRSPFEDSPYFKKGGVEEYSAPTFYSEWSR